MQKISHISFFYCHLLMKIAFLFLKRLTNMTYELSFYFFRFCLKIHILSYKTQ